MRQDQLDGLVTFAMVAESRGFSAAAIRLGISPSAVSQTIRQLERRVGVPLFHRTTRSISLTDAGTRFLEQVLPAVQTLAGATAALGDEQGNPSGQLRLNVSRAAFLVVVRPILSEFLRTYPDVNVEIALDNTLVDIVTPGFDAGIRFGHLVEKDMVGIPVGPPLSAHLIASPDYLAQRGTPTHPSDLIRHDCIGFRHASTGVVERWALQKNGDSLEVAVTGRLIVNDSVALVQAALDGLGIAYMINGYIDPLLEQGRLVRIMEEWSPALPGFTLYYASRKRVSRALRALIDIMQKARPANVADTAITLY